MEKIPIDPESYKAAVFSLLAGLTAQMMTLEDFIIRHYSETSNKKFSEVMKEYKDRHESIHEKVLEKLFAEFGKIGDDMQDFIKP